MIFSEAVFQTLRGVTGGTGLSWVSFSASAAQVGDVIFRVEPRYDTPWGVSLLAIAAVIVLSAWVLARRVRGVEVVTVSRPVVVAERMSKWYGQVIGLNDVTVSIPSGISGLLGPNGAGKSTLLKLVTGQLKPSQGQVQVLGEPIWDNPGGLPAHRLLSGPRCVLRADDRAGLADCVARAERVRG